MKCRQCDNESVYDDGLCEVCHRRAITEEATVMSDSERDNFRGQTIDEDGNIYNDLSEERAYGGRSKERIHIYAARGLPLRVKAALALIVFFIIAVIVGIFGLLIVALPYLLGILAVYFVYSVVRSFLR
ncbi:hypothetical protein [Anaeroglobus geminatus]|jgi:hypothetical protein|uniref:Uncharacterized protein n=1 Tax=Anaeroglobus geminatus F0357 TaxID=861450 RepID=G9YJP4_9FIRM|nr:hypothetical protein [Anaeroglobus geminatus]EHM38443.1 hypothetical protein HMPREF0080_01897 [Anaeroglobus geminatus F0357]